MSDEGIASTTRLIGLEVIDDSFNGHDHTESCIVYEHCTNLYPVRMVPFSSVITSPIAASGLSSGEQTIARLA